MGNLGRKAKEKKEKALVVAVFCRILISRKISYTGFLKSVQKIKGLSNSLNNLNLDYVYIQLIVNIRKLCLLLKR